ncbi:hypothetical protein BBOR36S_05251 [Brevibacillus borstelensis]|nr:hypothetical protein X546_25195 [Brevibacillus borstelensis cifa_chp40]
MALTVGAIILVLFVYIFSLHHDKRHLELKLESTVGHNLFLLLTSSQEVEDMLRSENVNSQTFKKIDEKLVEIYGYSMSIDSILGNDSLHNVAYKFRQVFSLLSEVQNNQQGIYLSQNSTRIGDLLQEWKDTIETTYYDKSDLEGGKAKLENIDFSKVETFEKKIEDYYQSIRKK